MKKEIGKRDFIVYDCIFNQAVHVLLNYTPEEYAEWLNKNKIKDICEKNFNDLAGFTTQITGANDRTQWLIYVKSFNWTIKEQGTLIHEITHAIIKIWQNNSISFNPDTQEFLAHSIGNLYEDIAAKIHNKSFKK